ncbi:MAG: lipoprotein [Pseudomonadota bacterium]
MLKNALILGSLPAALAVCALALLAGCGQKGPLYLPAPASAASAAPAPSPR